LISFDKYGKNIYLACLFMHAVQEILYQLIQGNDENGSSKTRSTPSSSYGHDQISNELKRPGDANYELQLAVDEAIARELQVMEDQLANTSLNDNSG
jgi:E3 ubiquitin-protein ligase BIG BROTHER and related proteins